MILSFTKWIAIVHIFFFFVSGSPRNHTRPGQFHRPITWNKRVRRNLKYSQGSWGIQVDGALFVLLHKSSSMYLHLRRFDLERPRLIRSLFRARQIDHFNSSPEGGLFEDFNGKVHIKAHSVRWPSSSIGLAVHAVRYFLHETFRANFDSLQIGTHLRYRAEMCNISLECKRSCK